MRLVKDEEFRTELENQPSEQAQTEILEELGYNFALPDVEAGAILQARTDKLSFTPDRIQWSDNWPEDELYDGLQYTPTPTNPATPIIGVLWQY